MLAPSGSLIFPDECVCCVFLEKVSFHQVITAINNRDCPAMANKATHLPVEYRDAVLPAISPDLFLYSHKPSF